MISDGWFNKPGFRPCGKIIYSSSLRTDDRLQFHDILVKVLDEAGEAGSSLGEALDGIFEEFRKRGIATETINIAR
jgi:hypothetical protein